MKKFAIGTTFAGILIAAGIGLAGPAAAEPYGGQTADDVVNSLQARGYDVQINGDQNARLSECTVTGVSGLSGSNANGQAGVPSGSTVYVGVSCDDDHGD